MSTWSEHAIFWQIYPLGFLGAAKSAPAADGPVEHRLDRIEPWMRYVTDLGCSALLLGPIFASSTHGYDTIDYLAIDPRLGDETDFDRFVAAATDRGLQVVLDGVFNHVGRDFAKFKEADNDPSSSAAQWFRRTGEGWDYFEGHDILISLNHDEPAVLEYVVSVMRHWLDRGVSGWRLDAAYAVPTEFWRKAIEQVRQTHPDAWFVAELIHGDYAEFASATGVDSVTQYELWKSTWSSLNDSNFYELSWTLQRHNEFLASTTPMVFVGNHDVSRIASQLETKHLEHALVLLFTVGGIPSIYAGDEQAFEGVKEEREGGDDAVRPEFPSGPDGLAPFGWSTYTLHQRLIGVRRRHSWLVHARSEELEISNETFAYRLSDPAGSGGQVVVLLNIGADDALFDVDLTDLEILDSSHESAAGTVPADGWAILGN